MLVGEIELGNSALARCVSVEEIEVSSHGVCTASLGSPLGTLKQLVNLMNWYWATAVYLLAWLALIEESASGDQAGLGSSVVALDAALHILKPGAYSSEIRVRTPQIQA